MLPSCLQKEPGDTWLFKKRNSPSLALPIWPGCTIALSPGLPFRHLHTHPAGLSPPRAPDGGSWGPREQRGLKGGWALLKTVPKKTAPSLWGTGTCLPIQPTIRPGRVCQLAPHRLGAGNAPTVISVLTKRRFPPNPLSMAIAFHPPTSLPRKASTFRGQEGRPVKATCSLAPGPAPITVASEEAMQN